MTHSPNCSSSTDCSGWPKAYDRAYSDFRSDTFKNDWTRISNLDRVTIEGDPAWRYQYDVPRDHGGLAMTIGNASGSAAVRGAFWIEPDTLDLLRIDMESYDISANLPVRSVIDRMMYWRVLVGTGVSCWPAIPSFC